MKLKCKVLVFDQLSWGAILAPDFLSSAGRIIGILRRTVISSAGGK